MRPTFVAALLLAVSAPLRAQGNAEGGHAADPFLICMEDVKDDAALITQGFFWVKDGPTAAHLTGRLAAHLVCKAKLSGAKNACASLDRMQPAYHYDKDIGTMKASCEWLNSYADFYWEMMTATKDQKRFPACEAHLDKLDSPVKFFNIKAKAPRSADQDPSNDGGFWNMCKVIGERMRAGRSDICEPRVSYWLSPQVPQDMWKKYCDAVAKLWVQGDESFCDLEKPNDASCIIAAKMTKAFKEKNWGLCPNAGLERGLCLAKLSTKANQGCGLAWQDLHSDFCTQRAGVKTEDMPKKKGGGGAKPGPKDGAADAPKDGGTGQ